MTSNFKEFDEVWQTLCRARYISGEELIQLFKNKGQDKESACAFYEEWRGRNVLGIPLHVAKGQNVKDTKVPMMIRLTDKTGRDLLKSNGYKVRT